MFIRMLMPPAELVAEPVLASDWLLLSEPFSSLVSALLLAATIFLPLGI
jgi:hypothetical protein